MAEALVARGLRCELRFFAGEAHGFRRAETLVGGLRGRAGLLPRGPARAGRRGRLSAGAPRDPLVPWAMTGAGRPASRRRWLDEPGDEGGRRVRTWEPEEGDAVLYGLSALFAAASPSRTRASALYRQWAELAVGPYLGGGARLGRRRLGAAGRRPDDAGRGRARAARALVDARASSSSSSCCSARR